MTTSNKGRRLIEDWFPVNEISIEAIRERVAASALPPVNWLHVWWARRPLATSRAAIAASLLSASADRTGFYDPIGTHPGIVDEQERLDEAKATGTHIQNVYSMPRAFTQNVSKSGSEWLQANLVTSNPIVLDITAGGGSIPFEAGRLGFRTIANELNPVAGLILRATCEWPQKHGWELHEHFQEVRGRYLDKVRELTGDIYPEEPKPKEMPGPQNNSNVRAKRYAQTYLFARTLTCPSCEGTIPLSPTWRLDSKGTGIRLIPDTSSRTCSFEIVTEATQHSTPTKPSKVERATCPYPDCGATTPVKYIPQEAQAGRLGHQLYCIIYRDTWITLTKSGHPSKRPKTSRGFRIATPKDDNTDLMKDRLAEMEELWEKDNTLPTEEVQNGDKTKTLLDYGMPRWRDIFSARQLLAHGYCVQAFQDLVDEDQATGKLDEVRKATWCYVALAMDKLINNNSLHFAGGTQTDKL